MTDSGGLLTTDLPGLTLLRRGKVRDIYDLGDTLLFIATDRLSAFDVILPNGIPNKGKILTRMSVFWFHFLSDVVPNHLVTADVNAFPTSLSPYRDQLAGRSMIVRKAERIDCECIARGYISGSLWKELQQARVAGKHEVHGFSFSPGLSESGRLPFPIFTPSTKNDNGHDSNISYAELANRIGEETASAVKRLTLGVYRKAFDFALRKGIVIADTKLEFGWHDGRIILIDEVLSPDSSRFWPLLTYQQGRAQESLDKQPVRDYLESIGWNKMPPAPKLPDEVIAATIERYSHVERIITDTYHG